ncbi:unnamed protein product, partial [Closterium sp. NIES-53]
STKEGLIIPFESTKEGLIIPFESTKEGLIIPFESTKEGLIIPFESTQKSPRRASPHSVIPAESRDSSLLANDLFSSALSSPPPPPPSAPPAPPPAPPPPAAPAPPAPPPAATPVPPPAALFPLPITSLSPTPALIPWCCGRAALISSFPPPSTTHCSCASTRFSASILTSGTVTPIRSPLSRALNPASRAVGAPIECNSFFTETSLGILSTADVPFQETNHE